MAWITLKVSTRQYYAHTDHKNCTQLYYDFLYQSNADGTEVWSIGVSSPSSPSSVYDQTDEACYYNSMHGLLKQQAGQLAVTAVCLPKMSLLEPVICRSRLNSWTITHLPQTLKRQVQPVHAIWWTMTLTFTNQKYNMNLASTVSDENNDVHACDRAIIAHNCQDRHTRDDWLRNGVYTVKHPYQ